MPVKCKTVFGATDVVVEKCSLPLTWEGTDRTGFHALMRDEPVIFSHLFHYLFVRDDLTNTSIVSWKGYNTTQSLWTIYFSQIHCHITKYSISSCQGSGGISCSLSNPRSKTLNYLKLSWGLCVCTVSFACKKKNALCEGGLWIVTHALLLQGHLSTPQFLYL